MKNVVRSFEADLPTEGARTHLTETQVQAIIDQTFAGIRRPAVGHKEAHVLHGPPGTGKTYKAPGIYAGLPKDGVVYIGADEHGVMDKIPEYVEGIKDAPPEERHKLWKKYQNDADYVRSLILNKAMREGYSVFLDTTGGGEKGVSTARALKERGYDITLYSFWAPLEVCVARVLGRTRQADPRYLVTKRLDAYRSFVRIWNVAQSMHLYYSTGERPDRPGPGEVLHITKVKLQETPHKKMPIHKQLLGRMIRELPVREGDGNAMQSLEGVTTIAPDERQALKDNATAFGIILKTLGGDVADYSAVRREYMRPVTP
jgi:predicted ABC-type ATPase